MAQAETPRRETGALIPGRDGVGAGWFRKYELDAQLIIIALITNSSPNSMPVACRRRPFYEAPESKVSAWQSKDSS